MRRAHSVRSYAAAVATAAALAAATPAHAGECTGAGPFIQCSRIVNQTDLAVRAWPHGCFSANERYRHVAAFPCRNPGTSMVVGARGRTPPNQDWDFFRVLRGYYATIHIERPWPKADIDSRLTAHSGRDVYIRVHNDETLYIRQHAPIP